jgi:Tfp pilus assembly protein PilV
MMRRAAAERGFTIVEVLVAAAMLLVGILATLTAFDASRHLTTVSERQSTLAQRAQNELEHVLSMPWSHVALTGTTTSWSSAATDPTYVSNTSSGCPGVSTGDAPQYQPDHSPSGSSASEPLVINGCSYTTTTNGQSTTTTPSTGTVSPVEAWSAPLGNGGGTVSGNVYDFVTWAADPTCSQTATPGSVCPITGDYKRVTVVVTLNGATHPSKPAIVSGLVTPPNNGHNPNSGGGTTCTNSQGVKVTCTNTPPPGQTGEQFYFCDTSYASSSCGEPVTCAGNNHDLTVVTSGGTAPAPDQLGSGPPTGNCQTSDTPPVPIPPCFALDLGCGSGGGGLPLPGTGSGSCSSPPASNSQSHSWVTPAIPAGTTWTLTGTGNMTAYVESGTGQAINATLCMGLYLVPAGVLGVPAGNLLAHPIGAAVSASVYAAAGVPTPVAFDFNVGSGTDVVASTGLTRLEVVVWIAGTSSPVNFVYDQSQFASQVTLMLQG